MLCLYDRLRKSCSCCARLLNDRQTSLYRYSMMQVACAALKCINSWKHVIDRFFRVIINVLDTGTNVCMGVVLIRRELALLLYTLDM